MIIPLHLFAGKTKQDSTESLALFLASTKAMTKCHDCYKTWIFIYISDRDFCLSRGSFQLLTMFL